MFEAILANLQNTLCAMIIFLCAYFANMLFGTWYNVKIRNQPFDRQRIITSVFKILVFVVGLALLVISVTALPIFADQVGWAIPPDYQDVFADLVIIAAVLTVSIKYIKEAQAKLNAILNADNGIIIDETAFANIMNANMEIAVNPGNINAGVAPVGELATSKTE